MKLWKNLIVISTLALLTACNGSSSNNDKPIEKTPDTNPTPTPPSNPSPSTPDTIEYGRVIDGYLENARICIDKNENLVCDDGESIRRTDDQGRFELNEYYNQALLVQAQAGITRDKDDNQLVKTSFVMQAPASHTGLVTPYTTLQVRLEKSGLTTEEAINQISNSFNISADELFKDYIASNNSKIQKIAKLIILMVQEINTTALANVNSEQLDQQQAIIEQLSWTQLNQTALLAISTAIENNSDNKTATAISNEILQALPELLITNEELVAAQPNPTNSEDKDTDRDGIKDNIDNCPGIANSLQEDLDSDGQGDVCDADKDGDAIVNFEDNCPNIANTDQSNLDGDDLGDVCDDDKDGDTLANTLDNCPIDANPAQDDLDNDGLGDTCDNDKDGDTILNTDDNCPATANTNQEDLNNNGTGDACEDLSQFTKVSATGITLSTDASDYACVTQNTNALGQVIPQQDRNTWILLIPADTSYADLGLVPTDANPDDKFWQFLWIAQHSGTKSIAEANVLNQHSSHDSNIERFVNRLNELSYCGFTDWTVPSIVQMQSINTKPLLANNNIKTLDRDIFKNFADFETLVASRTVSSFEEYKLKPYFWTSDRIIEDSQHSSNFGKEKTGISDFKSYLHPTEVDNHEDIYISSGDGFALRAVRQDRFQRISVNGSELNLTSNDWTCVKDNDSNGRRYWTNPVNEASQVTFEVISDKITAFNNANSCGFSDWRLPTKQELMTLKPLISNTYFKIGPVRIKDGYNWNAMDYVWLQETEENPENVMHSWQLSDYGLTHGQYSTIDNANLFLVRDDVFSAANFDTTIENHVTKITVIDDLKSDFDNININTSAAEETDIKAAFLALSTLPDLVEDRQQKIAAAKAILTTAETQYAVLYVDMKTTERTHNLSIEQAAQIRIQNELTVDGNNLKAQLDELLVQYDALSTANGFSSDTIKAEVLNAGITSANTILTLLVNLGDELGDNSAAVRAELEVLISARETEAEALPVVSLNGGFFKIAKNGDEAKASANYGDSWRCVRHIETVDDFTTTSFWTLLNEPTDSAIKRAAMNTRLATINAKSLCGINTWEIPDVMQLKTLSILDIITEDNEATKTIDPKVFINHKEISSSAPQYWYKDSSSYVLRYATPSQKEDDQLYVSSYSGTDIANARFIQQKISYQKIDMTCGENAIIYQDRCYQVYNRQLTWEQAKQSCIDNGRHLIEKEALTEKDYMKLAIGLNLISGSEYWLTKTLSQYSYPNYLKEDSNDNWEEKTYGTKTDGKNYICTGPTVALDKPAIPTSPSHDDDANTFGWVNVTGYNAATDYQFSLDNGVNWKEASTNPINVGNKNLEVGHVQIRVKSAADQNQAGGILKSLQAYTKVEGLCSGGDAAAEINDACYTRHDSGKIWIDARDFCVANSASLVTKAVALSIASDLENGLSLSTSSSIYYWLLDNELQYTRAKTLSKYGSWGTWDKDPRYPQRFICVK